MGAEIEERLKKIILDHVTVDAELYSAAARFVEDLQADSLDTVEIVMAIEHEFGIEIEDEIAEKTLTVGQAIELVNRLVALKTDRQLG